MEGNWANLLYLSIFLAFLLYGLAGSKSLKSKDILRYSIYWIAIALVLIIAYSYRSNFQGFTDKISGEINPSRARLNQEGHITINSSLGGHFYINLSINNQKVRLMVDTGATDLTLSLNDARRIGLDISKLNFNKRYHTANGITHAAMVTLDHVRIANLEFENVKASINQGHMSNSLLGINFLKRFKKYEFSNHKLILTP